MDRVPERAGSEQHDRVIHNGQDRPGEYRSKLLAITLICTPVITRLVVIVPHIEVKLDSVDMFFFIEYLIRYCIFRFHELIYVT